MDTSEPTACLCPQCGGRVRPDDAWCTLCYAPVAPRPPADPRPADPRPAAPRAAAPRKPVPQAAAPGTASRVLVGGQLPAGILNGLAADLAAQERAGGGTPRQRFHPAVLSTVGAFSVLLVLLVLMTVLGHLV